VNLTTNQIVGVEALMRWKHPKSGFIAPDIFIPLVERSRLIFDLGSFALKRAVSEAAACFKLYDADHLSIAVNLSPYQFYDPLLTKSIEETLEDNDFEPGRLVLEITENVAFEDIYKAAKIASRLRDLKVVLAIDDFGTGYSALSNFTLLQPKIIKIDKSLVQSSNTMPNGARLLEVMASIGTSLDAMVIAEGVETVTHLQILRELGYAYGQGYLFSHAVSPIDLVKLLEKRLAPTESEDLWFTKADV
jgi:EAL domain-containing protein (putative c-di-GMP-specific phosphodiesterase class I)